MALSDRREATALDLWVEVPETPVRVTTQVVSFTWPDTPANRKSAVVVWRLLTAGVGRPVCTVPPWYSWCVVVDAATALPLVTSLSPPRRAWAGRWVGVKLRRLGLTINAVITDGVGRGGRAAARSPPSTLSVASAAGGARWCRDHLDSSEQAERCKRQMKRVVQTTDKRTGRRRLATRAEHAGPLGMTEWIRQTLAKLPHLLPAIGSRRLPRTINGIERFFRTVTRLYKGRCGFHSVRSAKGELVLFVLVSLFTQRDKDGLAPIEAIVPEACTMPLYRLSNDPLAVLLGIDHVTLPSNMAMAKDVVTDALAA